LLLADGADGGTVACGFLGRAMAVVVVAVAVAAGDSDGIPVGGGLGSAMAEVALIDADVGGAASASARRGGARRQAKSPPRIATVARNRLAQRKELGLRDPADGGAIAGAGALGCAGRTSIFFAPSGDVPPARISERATPSTRAEAYLLEGSFSRQQRITFSSAAGSVGRCVRGGIGVACRMSAHTTPALRPGNGCCPVTRR
jgi:hypothetical protein